MLKYMQRIEKRRTEDGASAVEYGLLVAAIAALIVIIVFALGGLVKNVFKETCDEISDKAKDTITITETCDESKTAPTPE